MDASANGGRVRFFRNLGNVTMDLDDVESIVARTLGGTDSLTVNDLSGTDVTNVRPDLSGSAGGNDGASDNVIVNATNGDDVVPVTGAAQAAQVSGLAALRLGVRRDRRHRPGDGQRAGGRRRGRRLRPRRHVRPAHHRRRQRRRHPPRRRRRRHAPRRRRRRRASSAGRATTQSTARPATTSSSSPSAPPRARSAKIVGKRWLKSHARTVRRKTVLTVDGERHKLPRAKLGKLVRTAALS